MPRAIRLWIGRMLIILLGAGPGLCLFGDYPLIQYTVRSRDPLYSQQQQDVEEWYQGRGESLPLSIYRYRPNPSEDLFSVAAAFNLPYDSLATLNGWEAPGLFSSDVEVLVPNAPGLFVPEAPRGRWETTLSEAHNGAESVPVRIAIQGGTIRNYRFYPGEKFSSGERIRFLGSLFASPLTNGRITSPFGYRANPFSGGKAFHSGVDMRAAVGTPVKAARDGWVFQTGTLEIYGFFIIIDHDGGYQTVYAHLDEILVEQGQVVDAGDVIALSGNSGISTGPHLHFEIRRDGIPADPSRLTSFID